MTNTTNTTKTAMDIAEIAMMDLDQFELASMLNDRMDERVKAKIEWAVEYEAEAGTDLFEDACGIVLCFLEDTAEAMLEQEQRFDEQADEIYARAQEMVADKIIVSNGETYAGDYYGDAEELAEEFDICTEDAYGVLDEVVQDACYALKTHKITWVAFHRLPDGTEKQVDDNIFSIVADDFQQAKVIAEATMQRTINDVNTCFKGYVDSITPINHNN